MFELFEEGEFCFLIVRGVRDVRGSDMFFVFTAAFYFEDAIKMLQLVVSNAIEAFKYNRV